MIDRPVPREWRRYRSEDPEAWGTQTTDAAYRRGYHAAYGVTAETVNPYEPFSDPHRAWEAGWDVGRARLAGERLDER